MIRVMVVDDEPLSREKLVQFIQEENGFEVTATASHGEEALEKAKAQAVDIMFLDIEMPVLNGLETASRLARWDHRPLVVFVTAYEKYAIEAFEANAIDYLLKPYQRSRLEKTLGRIKELLNTGRPIPKQDLISLENTLIQKGALKKLAAHKRNSEDRMVIDPLDVFYFYTSNAEVHARMEQEDLILNLTLKELLARLDPAQFIQTHKSYVVNLNKIQKVSPLFHGNFEILFKSPACPKIPVSRRFAKSLESSLGKF